MDGVKKDVKAVVKRILGDAGKPSATKQIIIGASSGWLTGLLVMRVGKTAALALGGGILLLQIAYQKGYIKVNWEKINKDADNVDYKMQEIVMCESYPSWTDKVMKFHRKNTNFSAGLVGGFLIGLASC